MYPYTQNKRGGEGRNKNTTPALHTVWHISLSLNLQYILQFSFGVGNILLLQKENALLWPKLISSLVPPTWLYKHHTLLPSCDALCTLEKPTVNHKSLSSECTTSCLHFAQEASRGDSFLPSPFPSSHSLLQLLQSTEPLLLNPPMQICGPQFSLLSTPLALCQDFFLGSENTQYVCVLAEWLWQFMVKLSLLNSPLVDR